jgi:TPP-dependent pyruvate/acetoin dehydrogenase alpha subunit
MKLIKNQYKSILKNIVKSRKFQIEINKKILENKITAPVHLAFGHEFVAGLVYENFDKKKDKILLTHRNIHYSSIFSKDASNKYSKLYKNKNSNAKTKGSMNFTDSKSGIIYTSSILGNNLSVAVGVAKTLKEKNGYCVCVTGDGGIEEGSFYESLTLARYLELPIIFLVENNDWSMATTIRERRSPIRLNLLAKSLDVHYKYFKFKDLKRNIKTFSQIIGELRKNSHPIICEFQIATKSGKTASGLIDKYHHGATKLNLIDNLFIAPKVNDIVHKAVKDLG